MPTEDELFGPWDLYESDNEDDEEDVHVEQWAEDDFYENYKGVPYVGEGDIVIYEDSTRNLEQFAREIKKLTKKPATIGRYERCVRHFGEFCTDMAAKLKDERFLDCLENPNEISAKALELYIAHKCKKKGRRFSTASQAHSALAWKWDHVHDGRYSQKFYEFYADSNTIRGNPARSRGVRELLQGIEILGREFPSAQAVPMTIEDLDAIIAASEEQVSRQDLENAIKNPPPIGADRAKIVKAALHRAMISFGFITMARATDLAHLHARNITYHLDDPKPHLQCTFEVRKGRATKNPAQVTKKTYFIFQPVYEKHSLDAVTHMDLARRVLKSCLGRGPRQNDVLFPHVSKNGVISMDRQLSYHCVLTIITTCSAAAGIFKHYTTHSLRRGASQYFFMIAPVGHRWSLHAIKWWASWDGASVQMLMTYLLNELWNQEEDFSRYMDPDNWPEVGFTKTSFFGEACQFVTLDNLAQAEANILRVVQIVVDKLEDMEQKVSALDGISQNLSQLFSRFEPLLADFEKFMKQISNHFSSGGSRRESDPPSLPLVNFTFQSPLRPVQTDSASNAHVPSHGKENPTPKKKKETKETEPKSPPPLNLRIPDLTTLKGMNVPSWRAAAHQWTVPDDETGIALKDWKKNWYSGALHDTFATKFGDRKAVGMEFERLGSSEEAFRKEYPDCDKTPLAKMANLIRSKQKSKRAILLQQTAKKMESKRKIE